MLQGLLTVFGMYWGIVGLLRIGKVLTPPPDFPSRLGSWNTRIPVRLPPRRRRGTAFLSFFRFTGKRVAFDDSLLDCRPSELRSN